MAVTERNSCRYAVQQPICDQTRSRDTLSESKEIQLKNNTTLLLPALHEAISPLGDSQYWPVKTVNPEVTTEYTMPGELLNQQLPGCTRPAPNLNN